jgi:hypothetical protein
MEGADRPPAPDLDVEHGLQVVGQLHHDVLFVEWEPATVGARSPTIEIDLEIDPVVMARSQTDVEDAAGRGLHVQGDPGPCSSRRLAVHRSRHAGASGQLSTSSG